jgi:hypothetical protein
MGLLGYALSHAMAGHGAQINATVNTMVAFMSRVF